MEQEWPSYGRYIKLPDGGQKLRYTAIDPSDQVFVCTCKRPECPRNRLVPFREHIADLHRLLSRLRGEIEEASEDHDWDAVLYSLQMAASIDDVVADTGYVEDPMVFALCEPTIDYENGRSEMASKYVAGLTVFSFLWTAYEATVGSTALNELRSLLKGRLGERGRRLFEVRPSLSKRLEGLSNLAGLAEYHCRRGGLMDKRVDDIREKYNGHDAVFAAELTREFRNHVFHGEDSVPEHPDWALGGVRESRARLARFYSVGRLILLLIQGLLVIALEALDAGDWVDEDGINTIDALLSLQCAPVEPT